MLVPDSTGEREAKGTGTPWGKRTRGQKNKPRAISSPGHKNIFLLPWPAMRAHPTWQRPLSKSHLFLIFLPSTHADSTPKSYMLQPYLASSRRHGSHLLDLLIIIEIHPIIISTERSSRAVETEEEIPLVATTRQLRRRLQHAPNGSSPRSARSVQDPKRRARGSVASLRRSRSRWSQPDSTGNEPKPPIRPEPAQKKTNGFFRTNRNKSTHRSAKGPNGFVDTR